MGRYFDSANYGYNKRMQVLTNWDMEHHKCMQLKFKSWVHSNTMIRTDL